MKMMGASLGLDPLAGSWRSKDRETLPVADAYVLLQQLREIGAQIGFTVCGRTGRTFAERYRGAGVIFNLGRLLPSLQTLCGREPSVGV